MKYDCIIIGAGASGMMAAITAARQKKSVLILEKKDKIGKKIYATGNGKCNYTNSDMKLEYYHGNKNLIQSVLSQFNWEQTIDFFKEIGIYPSTRDTYYYPNSNQAASVVNALAIELDRLGVQIQLDCDIKEISYEKDFYKIKCNSKDSKNANGYEAKSLVFAVGLLAAPKLGSDGSAFDFIKGFGHRFTKVVPALCGFYCSGANFKKMAGVRTKANISIVINDREVANETGELQLTDYGISGIPVFQVSRFASLAIAKKKSVQARINFLPDFDVEILKDELSKRLDRLPDNKELTFVLNGLLPEKLWSELYKYAGIDLSFTKKSLKKRNIYDKQFIREFTNALIDAIFNFYIDVNKFRDFDFAQVCAGGIKSDEIDCETLESKLNPNMYFVGELLDVDGICGGYNLQWAWASGYVAGKSIK